MKKIEMRVKKIGSDRVWSETYEIPNHMDPEKYANNLIKNFNNTLREGEKPRELVDVKVIGKDGNEEPARQHQWKKTNLFTLKNRLGYYDAMRCSVCGITGKRYGIGGIVTRDDRYKAKVYETCDGAIKQIKKLRNRSK